MAFHVDKHWDPQYHPPVNGEHVEWLCSYKTLKPLLKDFYKKPRVSALVIGTGVSKFPEELYDSGIGDLVVMDFNKPVCEMLTQRNKDRDRQGLVVQLADVGEGINLEVPHQPFDLVVDKGTIDCILSAPDGWERAVTAIKSIYENMKTPATFIWVSHSPPDDRIELINTVYWHDIKVRAIRGTRLEDINKELYSESMVDVDLKTGDEYKSEWNHHSIIEAEMKARASGAGETIAPERGSVSGEAAAKKASDDKALAMRPGVVPKPPPLPYYIFQAGQAFVYELVK